MCKNGGSVRLKRRRKRSKGFFVLFNFSFLAVFFVLLTSVNEAGASVSCQVLLKPKVLEDAEIKKSHITKIIQQIADNHPDTNITTTAIKKHFSDEVRDASERLAGRRLSGAKLYELAIAIQPWSKWLKAIKHVKVPKTAEPTDAEVLAVIHALDQSDLVDSVETASMRKPTSPEVKALIKATIGRAYSTRKFYELASNRKKWHEWIKEAGVKSKFKEPTDQEIVDIIRLIAVNKPRSFLLALNIQFLKTDEVAKASQAILGRAIGGSRFYQFLNGRKKWRTWLNQAGFNIRYKRKLRELYTDEEIMKVFKALIEKDIPLHSYAVQKNDTSFFKDTVEEAIGWRMSGSMFLQLVIQRKLWYDWIDEAGLDSEAIRKSQYKYEDKDFIDCIKALNRRKIPLNHDSIRKNNNEAFREVAASIFGRPISGSTFYHLATKDKNWNERLTEAGFDSDQIRKDTVNYTESSVVAVIEELHKKNIPLNFSDIANNKGDAIREVTNKFLGNAVNGFQFLMIATNSRSWDECLISAGLDPKKIRKWLPTDFTEEQAISTIRAISDANIELSSSRIMSNSSKTLQDITEANFGRRLTGVQIYRQMIKRRNWYIWLSDAGLDITRIQLKGKIPYDLVNNVTRASLREIESRREAILGTEAGYLDAAEGEINKEQIVTETAEDVMMKEEFNESFYDFSDKLGVDDSMLLAEIIDLIDQGHEITDILSMEIEVGGATFSSLDVMSLFTKIKDNPEFIEIFS